MPSIGATDCTFVRGTPPALKRRLKTWQRPGLTGTGALDLGRSDGRGRVTAEQWDTQANVETWIAAIEDLQGQVVTITNDFGTDYENCLITAVGPAALQPYRDAGAVKVIGTLEIEFERTD